MQLADLYRRALDFEFLGIEEGMHLFEHAPLSDLMKGSPAEKAGFKVDDIIVAINTNFSNNVQQYKNMLQNTGETFRILINREGELKIISLKVKSILR